MKIVLHIGAPKTGSTALQCAFVQNRAALIEREIFYPESPTDIKALAGGLVSGNAIELAKFLNPNVAIQADAWDFDTCKAAIDRARRVGCSTVLYSSEYMSFFLTERMADFIARVATFRAQVEIIYFVRSIVGHATSSYRQHVRKQRFEGTFAAYLDRYRPPFSSDIERSIAAVGRERLTVLSFDECRASLFTSMIESLGHASTGLPAAPETNSSSYRVRPTDDERATIATRWSNESHRVNKMLGHPVFSWLGANMLWLLDLLIDAAPDAILC
jgi:hypothetical protein